MTAPKTAVEKIEAVTVGPPKDAKKPQDHKPKAEPKSDTLTATAAGKEWTVPRGALDDFELLDDLSRFEEGDATRLPALLRRLLGTDGYREAMVALRDEDTGRVSIEAGAEFVGALLGELDPNS